jgi:hypothetical protein
MSMDGGRSSSLNEYAERQRVACLFWRQTTTTFVSVSREASRDARVTTQLPFRNAIECILGHLAAAAGLMKRRAACLTFPSY